MEIIPAKVTQSQAAGVDGLGGTNKSSDSTQSFLEILLGLAAEIQGLPSGPLLRFHFAGGALWGKPVEEDTGSDRVLDPAQEEPAGPTALFMWLCHFPISGASPEPSGQGGSGVEAGSRAPGSGPGEATHEVLLCDSSSLLGQGHETQEWDEVFPGRPGELSMESQRESQATVQHQLVDVGVGVKGAVVRSSISQSEGFTTAGSRQGVAGCLDRKSTAVISGKTTSQEDPGTLPIREDRCWDTALPGGMNCEAGQAKSEKDLNPRALSALQGRRDSSTGLTAGDVAGDLAAQTARPEDEAATAAGPKPLEMGEASEGGIPAAGASTPRVCATHDELKLEPTARCQEPSPGKRALSTLHSHLVGEERPEVSRQLGLGPADAAAPPWEGQDWAAMGHQEVTPTAGSTSTFSHGFTQGVRESLPAGAPAGVQPTPPRSMPHPGWERNPQVLYMKVEPPGLGLLRVRVRANRDVLDALFLAQGVEQKAALERGLPELRQSLTHQGFVTQQLAVDVGGGGADWTARSGAQNNPQLGPISPDRLGGESQESSSLDGGEQGLLHLRI
jgi:hypothetical protein